MQNFNKNEKHAIITKNEKNKELKSMNIKMYIFNIHAFYFLICSKKTN